MSEDADLSGSKFREVLNEIIGENTIIDRDQAFIPSLHFNDEAIESGRNVITQGISIVKANLRRGNLKAARLSLGAVTHTLQVRGMSGFDDSDSLLSLGSHTYFS